MIYLAAPFDHRDEKVREERLDTVNEVAAIYMLKGFRVFSPLSHNQGLMNTGIFNNLTYSERWALFGPFDLQMLSFCTELDVLCIDGWETSIGIRNERNEADRLNIRERFTTYDDVIKGGRFG